MQSVRRTHARKTHGQSIVRNSIVAVYEEALQLFGGAAAAARRHLPSGGLLSSARRRRAT
jgi:hypothetical protein